MATNFPGSALDDFSTLQPWSDGTTVVEAAPLNNVQDAIDGLQDKVGINASPVASSLDFALRKAYVKVSDVKANTDGGTSTSATWHTRVLNTEDNDAGSLCSLSSNQVTLSAGTYRCRCSAPAYSGQAHHLRLYNTTGSAVLLQGGAGYCGTDVNRVTVEGQFTVAAGQALELQHYITIGVGTTGLGRKVGTANSIYAIGEFWKLY